MEATSESGAISINLGTDEEKRQMLIEIQVGILIRDYNALADKHARPKYSGPVNGESIIYLQEEIAKMNSFPVSGMYKNGPTQDVVRNAVYDTGKQYLGFIKHQFNGADRKRYNAEIMDRFVADFKAIEQTLEEFTEKYPKDVVFEEMYNLKKICASFEGEFELKLANPGDIIDGRRVEYMMFPGCTIDKFILEPECKFEQ